MYSQKDYDDICAQRRGRLLALCLPFALLAGLTLLSFLIRWPQGVTVALTIAAGALFIAGWSFFISPLNAYRKHIFHALNGHTSKTRGVFVGMGDERVEREGLIFWPLTLNVGAGIRDDGDRLFYYDAYLERPDFQPGEELELTSYDNRVIAWSRVQKE